MTTKSKEVLIVKIKRVIAEADAISDNAEFYLREEPLEPIFTETSAYPRLLAAIAQQLVQNVWYEHNHKTDERFVECALNRLKYNGIDISQYQKPVYVKIFHNCYTTHSSYRVTNNRELIDYMVDNYKEFEE